MMKYEVFNILILYERCTIIFFNQFEYLLPPHLPPSFWSNVLEGEEENFYTPVLRLFKTLILDNILKKTVHMLETLLYKWKRTLSVYMTLQIAETAELSVKKIRKLLKSEPGFSTALLPLPLHYFASLPPHKDCQNPLLLVPGEGQMPLF